MARYIKSYSNYVLKTKHQEIKEGIIYERDITTIGGRNQFAKGQVPIYSSGNFVITVNNDNTAYKKTPTQEWKGNDDGDVWTLDILKDYEKDEKSSYDEKIVVKKDYYDLRDFAYFGSCSELIRTSVSNIIDKFPGELFVPIIYVWEFSDGKRFYSYDAAEGYAEGIGEDVPVAKIETISVTYTDTKNPLEDEHGEKIYTTLPVKREFKLPSDVDRGEDANLFVIDNPFGINMHNYVVPEGEDPLKYFADGGINNYVAYSLVNGEWDFNNPIEIKSDGLVQYFAPNRRVVYDVETNSWCEADAVQLTGTPIYTQDYCPGDYMGHIDINMGEGCGMGKDKKCENDEVKLGFSVTGDVNSCYARIYVFMGDNNEVKYFFDPEFVKQDQEDGKIYTIGCMLDKRIRPKDNIIKDYYDSLNSFERILVDKATDYTSTFEVINESDYGYFIETKRYKFPTTYGGYNLGSKGSAFSEYLENLVKIGQYYDERFTDNLWRSMTHEAIKNFDWTYTRHFNPGDEIEYIEGGSKIQKIIRLYGREFDEIRSYIDGISNCNTITYDNVNNLPDYFFSDKLEDDGWDVKLVNPFDLKEYTYNDDGSKNDVTGNLSKEQEIANEYDGKHVERVFTEDYGVTSVKPYTKYNITSLRPVVCRDYLVLTASSENCASDKKNVNFDVENALINAIDLKPTTDTCNCDGEVKYTPEVGESQQDGYHDNCCNVVKIYSSEKEYTMSDVNSEFLKRFILNSKEILRHKSTIEGIEMLLGLFGLRSKEYVFRNETYFNVVNNNKLELTEAGKRFYKKTDLNSAMAYDFDVKEYTLFTTRIEDEYVGGSENMYHIDWINSLKLTTYNTKEFKSGQYVSYQGLPVAYRLAGNGKRYLYPSFQKELPYDGGLYYQMNGGWLSKKPFMFDTKNNIIPIDYTSDNAKRSMLFTETVKNIKCVQTLDELLSNKSLATVGGEICQVLEVKKNMDTRYAIIDGVVYKLLDEEDGSFSYFYATVENNSLAVGKALFTGYVYISNPYAENYKLRINLDDDTYNGKSIKIYVINDDVDVHTNSNSISTVAIFENGKCKQMDGDNYTNYFRINDPDFNGELSVMGWQQLKDTDYEYYLMDSISDYNKGNNPHTGHMNYDKGHEYLTYFSRLFKYPHDNYLFDDTALRDYDEDIYDEANDIGFKNLIQADECVKNYDDLLQEDDKCHYFGNLLRKNSDGSIVNVNYDLNSYGSLTGSTYRKTILEYDSIKHLNYGEGISGDKDGVTNQIVNTKRVDIDFFLNSPDEYSIEWLEEVKYIDSVILPYLTQIIPSTIILTVNYKSKAEKNCGEKKIVSC